MESSGAGKGAGRGEEEQRGGRCPASPSSCSLPGHWAPGTMSGRAGSAAPAQNGSPAAAQEQSPSRSPTLRQSYDLACKNKVVAVDGVKVKLQIWDTAGQERFRSVTHAYYRDAQALLLFYDITSKMSFDNIRAWLIEIHEYAQKDVVIMLLGNKADVSSERVIRMEDGESLAREYGVPFMETSAKTGMNVELAFLAIAKELKQRAVQHPDEPRFQIRDYIQSQKKKSSCCSFMVQVHYLPLCFARDGHYRFHPQLCTCAPHSAQEGRIMWGFKLAPSPHVSLWNMLLSCLKRECSIWEANSWSRLRL
ncbi:ras-related protein Rab-37 isoform X3 [Chrysemys picta bellii]|uniref:ras-related protein Rab-37 isoform X3 n=1 Tax=Chrysemys picta bellii TaxID=8478 RepID=UPI0032B2ABA7